MIDVLVIYDSEHGSGLSYQTGQSKAILKSSPIAACSFQLFKTGVIRDRATDEATPDVHGCFFFSSSAFLAYVISFTEGSPTRVLIERRTGEEYQQEGSLLPEYINHLQPEEKETVLESLLRWDIGSLVVNRDSFSVRLK